MVQIDVLYQGDLRCVCVHQPSRTELMTDAPLDNQGRGESYSPTDLVATALASCILTTMGIVARRHGWNMDGARARVKKVMVNDPARRIGRLETEVEMPGALDDKARRALETAAQQCPVHRTLAGSVEIPLAFVWGGLNAPSGATAR